MDNGTVTISAEYFAELYRKANDGERIRKYCFECNIAKERDELKAKLVYAEREAEKCKGIPTEYQRCRERLAEAERCIDDIILTCRKYQNNQSMFVAGFTGFIFNIIHAYRKAKYAK